MGILSLYSSIFNRNAVDKRKMFIRCNDSQIIRHSTCSYPYIILWNWMTVLFELGFYFGIIRGNRRIRLNFFQLLAKIIVDFSIFCFSGRTFRAQKQFAKRYGRKTDSLLFKNVVKVAFIFDVANDYICIYKFTIHFHLPCDRPSRLFQSIQNLPCSLYRQISLGFA